MAEKFPAQPILLVDDEINWLNSLAMSLKNSAGLNHLEKCTDSREVMTRLERTEYSLVLLDLTMPHLSGHDLLAQISERHPQLPVIVVSGMNQIETAVQCIKKGAEDFFVKTDDRIRFATGVQRILKQRQLQQENRRLATSLLQHRADRHPAFAGLVTVNIEMLQAFRYLEAVSGSREPVLISGESGVGKELVARALHQLSCPEAPWVAINVAGLDDAVFSDTLFGHVKGAFTGAEQQRPGMIDRAAGGILFLDEIGDLSMASQVKLLRLLQEGEYYPLGADQPRRIKARIVVATNQDLQQLEAAGHFRRDLLYRLWAHRVEVPPLRRRKEDIGPLVQHFLAEAAREQGRKAATPPAELITLLQTHSFPGNVRELRAMVYNAVSLHQQGVLSTASFRAALPTGLESLGGSRDAEGRAGNEIEIRFGDRLPTLKQVARLLVDEAMKRSAGNRSIAARLLGISHQALSKRLKNTD